MISHDIIWYKLYHVISYYIILFILSCDIIWCNVISHDDIDTVNISHSKHRPESQIKSASYNVYHMISYDIPWYHMISQMPNYVSRSHCNAVWSNSVRTTVIWHHMISSDMSWYHMIAETHNSISRSYYSTTCWIFIAITIIWYHMMSDDIRWYHMILFRPYWLLTASSLLPAMWHTWYITWSHVISYDIMLQEPGVFIHIKHLLGGVMPY